MSLHLESSLSQSTTFTLKPSFLSFFNSGAIPSQAGQCFEEYCVTSINIIGEDCLNILAKYFKDWGCNMAMKSWKIFAIVAGVGIIIYLNHLHRAYERYFSVERGDIVIDAGASRGVFTNSVADRAGLIVAIEPEAKNIAYLSERTRNLPNVIIIPSGLWNCKTELPLYLHKYHGKHSLFNGEISTMNIQVNTIDNIVSGLNLQQVDFIKMDIEGAELEALEGAEETLKKARKVVIAAYHIRDGEPTYNKIIDFLQKRGFKTIETTLIPNILGLVYGWKCP